MHVHVSDVFSMTKQSKYSTNKDVSGIFRSIPCFIFCWFSALSEFIAYLVLFVGCCLRPLILLLLLVFSGGCKIFSELYCLICIFFWCCLCSFSSIAYFMVFSSGCPSWIAYTGGFYSDCIAYLVVSFCGCPCWVTLPSNSCFLMVVHALWILLSTLWCYWSVC